MKTSEFVLWLGNFWGINLIVLQDYADFGTQSPWHVLEDHEVLDIVPGATEFIPMY